MAAGATYEPIATTTLSSAQSSVTFSSISGSYTDLVLVANAGASTAVNFWIQFNSDTGTNYSDTRLYGNGTTAGSDRESAKTRIEITVQSYVPDAIEYNAIIHFQNYSNTTTYKTLLARSNYAGGATDAVVGLWQSTSAITSIVVKTSSGTFDANSTFTLYGIAAA